MQRKASWVTHNAFCLSPTSDRTVPQVRQTDKEILAISPTPSSKDQQTLEALAMLVALRHWSPQWKNQRVHLAIRTDNIATLTMCCKMQPHSTSLGIIAREMALDIASSAFSPEDVAHIPGIANKAADFLSRRYTPNKPSLSLPSYLPEHLETTCCPRERDWWCALPRSA